jgi:hypothetical protein
MPQMEAGMSKETKDERAKRKLDLDLDRELEDTFPASDALKITRSRPEKPLVTELPGDIRPDNRTSSRDLQASTR